jgi:hypothetical protein
MADDAPAPRSAAGFRFSVTDGVTLAVAFVATRLLLEPAGPHAWLVPVVVGHFFLFCNVFRVRRSYELVWAAGFAANYVAWNVAGAFSWTPVLGAQTPLTLALIALEIRSPRYHGVFSRRD